MTIHYAILGILNYQPMAGYDLKKRIQDSIFMHWSGNNNQIYTALVELLEEGLVTNEVQFQDNLPSRKVYTITAGGVEKLRAWAASVPEPAEFKNSFLIQLAWADLLDNDAIHEMLTKYENEIGLQLIMNREKIRRGSGFTPRTERESFLWNRIDENILSFYQNELEWVRNTRKLLLEFGTDKEEANMNYQTIENENARYVELFSCKTAIRTEQDALDLISLCGEQDINQLMIHSKALSDDFFKLKTGIAGSVLQKFINYSVKVAIVIPDLSKLNSRFKELMSEANRSRQYRFFDKATEAEAWFCDRQKISE